jgi:hypothetical protein
MGSSGLRLVCYGKGKLFVKAHLTWLVNCFNLTVFSFNLYNSSMPQITKLKNKLVFIQVGLFWNYSKVLTQFIWLNISHFQINCGSHKLQRTIIILWKHIAFHHISKQPNDWIGNTKSSLPSYFLFHCDFIMKFVPYQYWPLVHVAYLWCTCWISFYWKVCTLH